MSDVKAGMGRRFTLPCLIPLLLPPFPRQNGGGNPPQATEPSLNPGTHPPPPSQKKKATLGKIPQWLHMEKSPMATTLGNPPMATTLGNPPMATHEETPNGYNPGKSPNGYT